MTNEELIQLWRETRQSYARGPVILAHVMDLGSKLADALASPPAPSGWQQRIAAWVLRIDDPYIDIVPPGWCYFCLLSKGIPHAPDCLWQNAVDAGQHAKDALPPVAEAAPAKETRCRCGQFEMPDAAVKIEARGYSLHARHKCSWGHREGDPITAAVDATLDPLKRELVDFGRKLAKDEAAYCTEDHDDGWCCTLLKGHTGDHIATNEHESNSENVKGRVYARWSGEVTR